MAGGAEQAWIAERNAAGPGIPWDRVLFSAKESVYKAWYSRTGERPGLRGMTVRICPAGTFAAGLLCGSEAPVAPRPGAAPAGPPVARLTGRWLIVYVYPKDDTPGCTVQGQRFTASKSEFDRAGIDPFRERCPILRWKWAIASPSA